MAQTSLGSLDSFEGLPRRPFKGRPLTAGELALTFRSPNHLYMRYVQYWFGILMPDERPDDFVLQCYDSVGGEDVVVSKRADVYLWRQPPAIAEYITTRTTSEIMRHAMMMQKVQENQMLVFPARICLN